MTKIMDSKPTADIWQFELMPSEMAAVLSQWMIDTARFMEDKPVTYFINLSVRLERTDDGIWAFRQQDGGIWAGKEYYEEKEKAAEKKRELEKEQLKASVRLTREVMQELELEEKENE